ASKSGFDAILAEAPSSVVDNIFPAFTFPNEGETKIINEDRKKSDSNKKGFGIVAAGSFKKVLPLISPLYDKFFRVDCIGSFYNIVVEMLASLQDGTICTAESFDETIPEDPESDYPVEIVMFRQQKGGFEEMSEPK
ncbi:MAG: hypothetical protein FWE67_15115, partial [Planctomycetaceae bacterium]|nr:hypothetical protein [Planctomycetaceae bacterium]